VAAQVIAVIWQGHLGSSKRGGQLGQRLSNQACKVGRHLALPMSLIVGHLHCNDPPGTTRVAIVISVFLAYAKLVLHSAVRPHLA